MNKKALIELVLLSVLLNASAQVLLRWGARSAADAADSSVFGTIAAIASEPAILAGMACYGISIAIWLVVLRDAEVSFAYPFLSLGFVVVAIAGWALLGESLTATRVTGIATIVVGVLVLARS